MQSINPFELIKEMNRFTFIVGKYCYEQEPNMVTIEYGETEDIPLDQLIERLNDLDENKCIFEVLNNEDLLLIPYSEFVKYGRIDDYVENGDFLKYNENHLGTCWNIYQYKYIVIQMDM